MYSKNTVPERGYERAKRFINEFNKKLGLTISSDEIDEVMNRDYTNVEKWETICESYVDEDGVEYSYLTTQNTSLKEVKGIRKLVRRMLDKNV